MNIRAIQYNNAYTHDVVIGGAGNPIGTAPFARARVVLRQRDTYLIVHCYSLDGKPEGDRLSEDYLETMQEEGGLFFLTEPVTPPYKTMFWLIAPRLWEFLGVSLEDELVRASPNFLGPLTVTTQEIGRQVFLVEGPTAERIQSDWHSKAFSMALNCCRERRLVDAKEYALRAFDLAERFNVVDLGLLLLVLDKIGEKDLFSRYLAMARRSRGDLFAENALLQQHKMRDLVSS